MTLKSEILRSLKERGRLQFCEICQATIGDGPDMKVHSIKVANALRDLREKWFAEREYVERNSFYEITSDGSAFLGHSQAAKEVSSEEPSGFANCDVVLSSDGETDASVYWNGPISEFAKDQISKIITEYPGIKIIGHAEK